MRLNDAAKDIDLVSSVSAANQKNTIYKSLDLENNKLISGKTTLEQAKANTIKLFDNLSSVPKADRDALKRVEVSKLVRSALEVRAELDPNGVSSKVLGGGYDKDLTDEDKRLLINFTRQKQTVLSVATKENGKTLESGWNMPANETQNFLAQGLLLLKILMIKINI